MNYVQLLRPFLPELTLTLGLVVILLAGIARPGRRQPNLSLVAQAAVTIALLETIYGSMVGTGASLALSHPLGSLPLLFRMMILFATSLVIFLAHDSLEGSLLPPSETYILLLSATIGMLLTAGADHLLLLFLGIEITSLSTVLLIALRPGSVEAKEASLKYLLYGLAASSVLLFGFTLVYAWGGRWDMAGLAALGATGQGGVVLGGALTLILAGFGFKLALAPFHLWAPDVYAGAPAVVTSFLATGPKLAVFAAAASLLVAVWGGNAGLWTGILAAMLILSMCWGNLAALAQRNLKRMMAYSGIAHVGYAGIGLLVATQRPEEGLGGLGFYLFTYLFANIGFFALLIWMEDSEGRGPSLETVAGLGKRQPWLGALMAVFLLALAGIPPTAGFMAKFWVFFPAVRAGWLWLVVIALLNSALGAFYYLRVLYTLFLKDADGGIRPVVTFNVGLFALFLAALVSLWFGVWPGLLLNLFHYAATP